jgi:drug/metabolite transporter (DMT)-like permease
MAVPILLLLIHFTIKLPALLQHHPGIHIIRGLLMFTAFMLFYVALSELSLTTTTALFFTAPFFITLINPVTIYIVFSQRVVVRS